MIFSFCNQCNIAKYPKETEEILKAFSLEPTLYRLLMEQEKQTGQAEPEIPEKQQD